MLQHGCRCKQATLCVNLMHPLYYKEKPALLAAGDSPCKEALLGMNQSPSYHQGKKVMLLAKLHPRPLQLCLTSVCSPFKYHMKKRVRVLRQVLRELSWEPDSRWYERERCILSPLSDSGTQLYIHQEQDRGPIRLACMVFPSVLWNCAGRIFTDNTPAMYCISKHPLPGNYQAIDMVPSTQDNPIELFWQKFPSPK